MSYWDLERMVTERVEENARRAEAASRLGLVGFQARRRPARASRILAAGLRGMADRLAPAEPGPVGCEVSGTRARLA